MRVGATMSKSRPPLAVLPRPGTCPEVIVSAAHTRISSASQRSVTHAARKIIKRDAPLAK